MKAVKTCILFASLALVTTSAFAQDGSIHGIVFDEQTGEELTGANVLVIGTTYGASTDLDGKYEIENIPPGTYDLRFSFIGYNAQVVTGIEVNAGDPVQLDVNIKPVSTQAFTIEDIVVSGERVLSTSAAVLAERKKSAIIGDAISADQIARSPDATSGDALKRVTGLSVVDNKFVFVRGVTDRYNGTSLNGVSVTSTDTDVDRKSFSFDLIPANLLANTVVVKTMTPDLPGDYSGGLVQVNTLDFPAERVVKISVSSSYDDQTSGETMFASQGGDTDWLGIDDGIREFPEDVWEDIESGERRKYELAQELPNTWAPREENAPWNGSFSASLGDRFFLGDHEFGFVGALSYKNGYETTDFSEEPIEQGVVLWEFEGTRYKHSVLWGGLLNLNYKPNGLHKLSLKTNFVQAAEDNVRIADGRTETSAHMNKWSTEWNERDLLVTQLGGDHSFPSLGGFEVRWKAFRSNSDAQEPDRKHAEYELGHSGYYILAENYRMWSELTEETLGAGVDFEKPLGPVKLKAGFSTEDRERDYSVRAFYTDTGSSGLNYDLLLLPIDEIFDPENYGPGELFKFKSYTAYEGEYDGEYKSYGYYLMGDYPFRVRGQKLRLVGGVRFEDWEQKVGTVFDQVSPDQVPDTTRIDKLETLPSANLTYALNDETNIRLAYSQSINRPEFRELANVLYYDFDRIQNVIGAPGLKRALVHNYDVRVELFPEIGEVLAVSFFYKDFEDAIEERLLPSPERFVRTWFNSPKGKNYGWELEIRKSLGFIWDYLDYSSITGNFTQVESEIDYDLKTPNPNGPGFIEETKTRVMQGQTPWMLNLTLSFEEPNIGTTASVLYHRFGRRLDAVADYREEDVYEQSREKVDVVVTQNIPGGLKAKFAVKNLTGEDEIFTRGETKELPYATVEKGTSYSLSLSFSL
jgi:outer membrane receptor protein involved in Fe transport